MAQSKLNDFAGKFKGGGPPGLGLGLKLLAGVGLAAYAATQSVYTGWYCVLVEISQFSNDISAT
jgi:hypothetical protein